MSERFSIPRACKFCKELFVGRDKNKVVARYCSRACHFRDIASSEQSRKAGRIGALKMKERRGTGNKGYVKENGRHQHRVVMEKHLGRKLISSEIVHHLDENKHNNAINNLQLVTRAEHARIHFHGITPTPKKDN